MNKEPCPFCDPLHWDIATETELSYSRWDKYPVSKGHTLIVPKRHFSNYFEATDEELLDLWEMVKERQYLFQLKFNPDGFNIGINIGEAAGQTISHLHIHLIPRYKGDMKDPRGGVRGVIPEKQKYEQVSES